MIENLKEGCMVYANQSPTPFLMNYNNKPIHDRRHSEHYRVKIPKEKMRKRFKELRRYPPKIIHRVQSRQVYSPQINLLTNNESVYSSDSDSGRAIFIDMYRNLFAAPFAADVFDCEEICERCYDRCKGLCLLQQNSDDMKDNYDYLFGPHAISINDCSRLNQSFEDIVIKNDFSDRTQEKVNFVQDAIRGLSKSFICSDNDNKVSNRARSIILDDCES
jgi:hypothetical protein